MTQSTTQKGVCVCVCYWPLVGGVCQNYEMVEFQHRIATPKKTRLCRLLLRSCS